MGRVVRGRGRGGLPAPKRQIANETFGDGVVAPPIATNTFGAATANKAVFSFGLEMVPPALTLVRTRGLLVVKVLTSGGVTNQIAGAFGMIVVSADAFTVGGVTSLPGPLSDTANDWFVWVPISLAVEAVNPGGDFLLANLVIPFDSRGMRKLKSGDTLAPLVELTQSDATTGTVIRSAFSARMQFKL